MSFVNSFSDEKLVMLLKEGNKDAFNEIYERYKYLLLTHAVNKLRDRDEARDVLQEAFIYLWDRRLIIRSGENIGGYLYTVTRHIILNKLARDKNRRKYVDSLQIFATEGSIEADFKIREQQLQNLIAREIAALPIKMREVFELSRGHHLSHREIADQLGISEQTVSKQISNALKILRGRLGLFAYLYLLLFLPR